MRTLAGCMLLVFATAVRVFAAEPGIVAHRGVILDAPENTIPAIQRAIDLGCAIVEIDLRYTADGEVVLFHDETLERTTNGKGPMASLRLAQLRALDAGSWKSKAFAGTRVPTFKEVIELARGRIQLYLDLKETDPGPVIRVVRELGAGNMVYFRPYHYAAMKQVVDADPAFRLLFDLEDWIQFPGLLPLLRKSFPTAALSSGIQNWTPPVLAEARTLGLTTFVNVLGQFETPENLRRAAEMEFDFIQTDRQAELKAILSKVPVRR